MPRKMKDSGIEWIGEIPESWKINTVFQIFTQVKNKNTNLQERNLLSLSYGKIKRKNIDTTDGLLPESFDGYNIIEAGDIVLRLTDLQNDHKSLRVGLATERGIVTSAYLTIRNRSKSSEKYLYYYLHSFDVAKGFYGMGAGVRQGLNWDGLKWLKILSPSVQEQNRIVSYLDTQCARIDAVLEQTRNSIEEYKKLKQSVITQAVTKGIRPGRRMKDSGIEFIGMIPDSWEFSRMKNVAYIVDCKNRTPDNLPEGEYTVVRTACIRNGMFTYEGSYKTDETNYRAWTERGAPRKGDVFFTREAPVGEACMVPDDPSLCMGQRVMYFRPNDGVDGRFLMYSVYSSLAQEYIMTKNNGSTVGHLKLGQVGELPLLICSCEEQKEISDYLDSKVEGIEALICNKQRMVAELESYKKSLIYECVTGKRVD